MFHKNTTKRRNSLQRIQQNFLRIQLILVITLALFLGVAGSLINIYFEKQKRDENLQNIADTIANSPILIESLEEEKQEETIVILKEYLDSLQDSLSDIDVISVVNHERIRLYHSNHELIGTIYDGTIPTFKYDGDSYYATNDYGPSGRQRRVYAGVYDKNGNYVGFVMAIMLMENIWMETAQIFIIFILITIVAILMEMLISSELSNRIKESLLGFEPDVFSAMYQIRDNILESLDEGIIAVDNQYKVQFLNKAAIQILQIPIEIRQEELVGKPLSDLCSEELLARTLESGEKEFNVQAHGLKNVVMDRIPIKDENEMIGAVGILHNRAEYTKLMEDLTGTRYLVDSMRANNHDFTNKLHVILGLIQMEMYEEAISYIENITIVQRMTIGKIMKSIGDPSVAALLIGKTARAAELNIKFIFREGCTYSNSDISLPSEMLVTIIGNLIDNAFEAMNEIEETLDRPKELLFGIYSNDRAILLTVDDTGVGIEKDNLESVFEKGFSTKGIGRGTGLYQVKNMVNSLGGTITVESQKGIGTSFSVSFCKER